MIFDAIRRWMGHGPGGSGGNGGHAQDGGDSGMIRCEDALARLQEFLDGELQGATREEVQRHFDVCARCYPHLQLEKAFRAALHRAVERGTEVPAGLRERVLELTS